MPSDSRPFVIELPLQVKTYDIDFSGVVSNIVYVRWLEDLRLLMLATYFPLEKQLEAGFAPVVAHTRIEYKRPVKMFDKPTGRMWVSEMDSRRWVVTAEISVRGKIATTAEQSGLFVDVSHGRPIPIPEELLKKYLEYRQGASASSNH